MKRCYKCGQEKDDSEFFWKGQSICRECGKERNRAYKRQRYEQMKALPTDHFAGLTKQCTACHAVKPVEEFTPSISGQYGRRSVCNKCETPKKRTRYHERHPDARYNDYPHFSEAAGCVVKRCSICGVEKPVTEFHRRLRAYHAPCKVCTLAEAKRRYDADPEKHRAKSREYARQHREEHRARYYRWEAANREYRVAYYRHYNTVNRDVKRARDREARRNWPAERRYAYYSRNNFHRHARLRRALRGIVDRLAIITRDQGTCYLCGCKPQGFDLTLDHVIPLARGGTHTADNLRVACRPCNSRKGANLPI